ncbi:MAG: NAD(P)/FAD-dependent oxidoreductase [Intestinibacter bartlettii]|uniref:NAD(P)/FAD-dependent oxidoreductase n=1 Tax=Intestinibacter bartlettii TaxID=261299 RepID=UPI0026F35C21|nr:NAD(P)/FAD-dependent oxidoreductase [Intestinibacter bartlettii]MDO5009629.1 NAD(P)/FAD-dependent oxidoreductase [Intestinibacter bartlettii]
MYDVVIIGAGVSGSASARELSRYKVNACVIEKAEDVCSGTSKANSGIVHAGFDANEGSLMAKLNVEGNLMMEELSKELDFPFKKNGSLVICLSKDDMPKLQELYDRGIKNGVKELKILNREEVLELEPNITDDVYAALYAPTGGIVCPFSLNIALAENANTNGIEFKFNTEAQDIEKIDGGFIIKTNQGDIKTKYIVNAAGVYADKFHNMVSENKINITARKGEYCLLDKTAGNHVSRTIFALPGKMGKGVLVSPTVHGNLIVGPTSTDIDDKEGVNTTREGLDTVIGKSSMNVKNLPMRQVITSFSGLRAHEDHHEFIIEELEDAKGFIDCAGIESPGLTSSPAIGKMVANILKEKLNLEENPNFVGTRKGILDPNTLSLEERNQLIKEQPAYGNIICRCEMITEGEIIDAIRRPLGAKSLDGVKRRTRAGMGRCQAGFCSPKTMEILERELNLSMFDITKAGGDSNMVVGLIKDSI